MSGRGLTFWVKSECLCGVVVEMEGVWRKRWEIYIDGSCAVGRINYSLVTPQKYFVLIYLDR